MLSKSLAVAALAVGCVMAAAGGAFLAVRQNGAVPVASAAPAQAAPAATPAIGTARPVAETEALVLPLAAVPASSAAVPAPTPAVSAEAAAEPAIAPPPAPRASAAPSRPTERPVRKERQSAVAERSQRAASAPAAQPTSAVTRPVQDPEREQPQTAREVREPAAELPPPVAAAAPIDPPPPAARFEELVVPASSVVGLRMETALSTERARIEDRVDARVTRDVVADGRVAIPAGARAIGTVTLVERGGKVKERARLGVRFHTLVLGDGTELPINTEAIYREGDSPAGESGRKIGGAAVGGAILGALLGGKKGAIVGGATGAAGGTAVVMASDRNAATLPSGTIVTIRLAAPVPVEVEKR